MDDDTFVKWLLRGMAIYLLAAVVCYGPATVQSERAWEENRARCLAEREGDAQGRRWCGASNLTGLDGAFKAIFWPAWISYTLASK